MSLIDRGESTVSKNCWRLVVLGSPMVGKSAIIKRFLYDTFDTSYTPTVEDFHRKIYKIRRQTYKLDILDCSGQMPFPAARKLSYMTGDMFLLVYDVCNRDTFEAVKVILEQLNECFTLAATNNTKSTPVMCPPLILVGNHIDKDHKRVVLSTECLTLLAGRPSCAFVEVSAKYNLNIDDLFVRLFELAKLPMEMTPARHRKVTPSYVVSSRKTGICGFFSRKISEACGVIQPDVRRPSVTSDMQTAFEREIIRKGFMQWKRNTSKKNDASKCRVQ
ncbi:GTP binding [Mactra antiquata]